MNIISMRIERKNQISLSISAAGGVKPEDYYDGPYSVIPKFENQLLETKNKIMIDDVNVLEIPVERVGNLGGGYTVTIGG